MRLLAGRTPPAVLVRHHRDGRPVSPAQPIPSTPTALPADPVAPLVRTPPPSGTRERLRDLWAQALGTTPNNDEEDFFDQGGDSLAAVELMARIRSTFGIELSIGLLLDARTYGALLALVEEQLDTPT